MSMPFFFQENIARDEAIITFNKESSKHVVTVLRMQVGDQLRVTDGKGNWILGAISDNHKRKCTVTILDAGSEKHPSRKITIAISLLKNSSRFEWFLEKATEIGINEIIPMICARTERQQFRYERMHGIMLSAMLQSQQVWLPALRAPAKFEEILQITSAQPNDYQKLIAHCGVEGKQIQPGLYSQSSTRIILIGPEGDFTNDEISRALKEKFVPVSLGETRLRTETAGVVAAAILNIM